MTYEIQTSSNKQGKENGNTSKRADHDNQRVRYVAKNGLRARWEVRRAWDKVSLPSLIKDPNPPLKLATLKSFGVFTS